MIERTDVGEKGDYLEMVGLLKSCTAFEAYCKVYTADLSPERIAEFHTTLLSIHRRVRKLIRSSTRLCSSGAGSARTLPTS